MKFSSIFLIQAVLVVALCNSAYVTNDGTRIEDLLNAFSFEHNYESGWNETLDFVDWPKIQCSGLLSTTFTVNFKKTLLENVPELQQYFNSEEYVVGDPNTHEILSSDMIIMQDLAIEVMKNNSYKMDFEEPMKPEDVDVKKFVDDFCAATKVDPSKVIVRLILDDDGNVVSVVVILPEEELINDVQDALKNLDWDGNCPYQIICRTKHETQTFSSMSLEEGHHTSLVHDALLVVMTVALLVMTIV